MARASLTWTRTSPSITPPVLRPAKTSICTAAQRTERADAMRSSEALHRILTAHAASEQAARHDCEGEQIQRTSVVLPAPDTPISAVSTFGRNAPDTSCAQAENVFQPFRRAVHSSFGNSNMHPPRNASKCRAH